MCRLLSSRSSQDSGIDGVAVTGSMWCLQGSGSGSAAVSSGGSIGSSVAGKDWSDSMISQIRGRGWALLMFAGCGVSFVRVKEGGRGESFCSIGWEGVAVIVIIIIGIPLS